jgi:hypothetical protein
MLSEWEWFILLPLALVLGSVWIGAHAQHFQVLDNGRWITLDALRIDNVWEGWRGGFIGDYDMALRLLASIYFGWNAWHFGSQHFGVATLLGWRSGPRWRRQALTIGPTVAILMLPTVLTLLTTLPLFPLLVLNELISLLHWTTDIGLSSWKARNWLLFLCAMTLVGPIGFAFKHVTTDPHLCHQWSVCQAKYNIPVLLGLRAGLGFVHFLYSRWRYQTKYMRLMEQAA